MSQISQDCPLTAYMGTAGTCVQCAAPLIGRATTWCSTACQWEFYNNHRWTNARAAAMQANAEAHNGTNRCVACGHEVGDTGTDARRAEVNHITPILGRHGQNGCWHHLDGLEVLCRECHQDITRLQFAKAPVTQESLFGEAS